MLAVIPLSNFRTFSSSQKETPHPAAITYCLPPLPNPACVCVCSQLYPTLCDPMHYSPQGSSVQGTQVPGKNIGSGLPFLILGSLPDPGIEPPSPVSPALQVDSLLLHHLGSSPRLPLIYFLFLQICLFLVFHIYGMAQYMVLCN